SRLGEIQRMLPVFLEAAAQVASDVPDLQIVIPAANPASRTAIEASLAGFRLPASGFRILDRQAHPAMIASHEGLHASGTAALEAMLCKRPMVVGHRIAPLTHFLVRKLGLLRSRFVSLPNVLAGDEVVPELLQDDCTADRLAAAVGQWFAQPEAMAAL